MNRREFLSSAALAPLTVNIESGGMVPPDNLASLRLHVESGLEVIHHKHKEEYPLWPYEYVGSMLDTKENRETLVRDLWNELYPRSRKSTKVFWRVTPSWEINEDFATGQCYVRLRCRVGFDSDETPRDAGAKYYPTILPNGDYRLKKVRESK